MVTRAGRTYRVLAGSARRVKVSLVGLAKGTYVVKIAGTSGSRKRWCAGGARSVAR